MKKNYIDWLSSYEWDALGTLTLKQAVPVFNGNGKYVLQNLTREDAHSTAVFFVKRLNKLVLASRAKMGERLSILSFVEGDGISKRYHIHLLIKLHPAIQYDRLEEKFHRAAASLIFGHSENDLRKIRDGDSTKVVSYCFKEGGEAFIPTASFIGKL